MILFYRLGCMFLTILCLNACFEPNYESHHLTRISGGFDPTRYEPPPPPPINPGDKIPTEITFSMTPYFSPEVHRNIVTPIAQHLEKELSIPVVIKEAETYRDLINYTINNEVDVALISPLAFVLAKEENPKIELLAAVVAQGTTTYSGYLVTPTQSEIITIADAKNKRLALVDPVSTSGSLFPKLFFQQQNIVAETFFSEIIYTGTHDKALSLIRENKVDLAAVSSDTLVGYNALGPGGFVRIVANTGRAPYDALVASSQIPPWLRAYIKTIFLRLSIHTQEGRAILSKKNLLSGFIPVNESHYKTVKAAAQAGGLIKK